MSKKSIFLKIKLCDGHLIILFKGQFAIREKKQ